MKLDDLVQRADALLGLGQSALSTTRRSDVGEYLAEEQFATFRTATLSYIANVFGPSHPYYKDFDKNVDFPQPGYARVGLGIIAALRDELAGGWLVTTKGLVSAEIFGDFLEMADHLASEQYKDAAAVIAGSSLEEHLRQLAPRAGVSVAVTKGDKVVPKKADLINAELAAAGTYSKLDQKSITAWLDLRNKAAHGKYAEYDQAQVRLMIEGVRQFMARVTA